MAHFWIQAFQSNLSNDSFVEDVSLEVEFGLDDDDDASANDGERKFMNGSWIFRPSGQSR